MNDAANLAYSRLIRRYISSHETAVEISSVSGRQLFPLLRDSGDRSARRQSTG